jgi:2-methylisocitrate lyase-like PEP mutase family enzyme
MPALPNQARAFHALHTGPDVLLLPNAWDAGSARIIESVGAKAIATSSAAVAWSHGYSDGHDLPIALLVRTVEQIARVVHVPITADAEGGYSDDPGETGENVFALCNAGAVGINLEDGRDAPALHARKIEAARKVAARAGVDLYINARTDVYLKRLVAPEAAVDETIKRGLAAKDAGASGLFVPGVTDAKEIGAIVAAVGMPVNVMARPGVPPAAELKKLGVRRLSAATGVAAAAWASVRAATGAFLAEGDSDVLAQHAGAPFNYNELFKPKA